jgi:hypothetical protein
MFNYRAKLVATFSLGLGLATTTVQAKPSTRIVASIASALWSGHAIYEICCAYQRAEKNRVHEIAEARQKNRAVPQDMTIKEFFSHTRFIKQYLKMRNLLVSAGVLAAGTCAHALTNWSTPETTTPIPQSPQTPTPQPKQMEARQARDVASTLSSQATAAAHPMPLINELLKVPGVQQTGMNAPAFYDELCKQLNDMGLNAVGPLQRLIVELSKKAHDDENSLLKGLEALATGHYIEEITWDYGEKRFEMKRRTITEVGATLETVYMDADGKEITQAKIDQKRDEKQRIKDAQAERERHLAKQKRDADEVAKTILSFL